MASVTLRGNPCSLKGNMPKVGDKAPDFHLTKIDMSGVELADLRGKTKIIVTVPSLDTPVCQVETRKFNERASALPDTTVVLASADLPFAVKRFCAAEGVQNVHGASDVRDRGFAERWGVAIADGPLQGITARAVFVVDKNDKVAYVELVPEIGQEPNYDAALAAAAKD